VKVYDADTGAEVTSQVPHTLNCSKSLLCVLEHLITTSLPVHDDTGDGSNRCEQREGAFL
jgi:hypothetical protein